MKTVDRHLPHSIHIPPGPTLPPNQLGTTGSFFLRRSSPRLEDDNLHPNYRPAGTLYYPRRRRRVM